MGEINSFVWINSKKVIKLVEGNNQYCVTAFRGITYSLGD